MSEPWKPQQTECLIRKNLSHLLLLVHSEDDLLFVACLLINGIDFLAVQNSSIGDLVTDLLTDSLTH